MDIIDENIPFNNITNISSTIDDLHLNSVYLPQPSDDLSFSIYVDSKNHMKQYRRKIKRWVSDDSVTMCKSCSLVFSMWYRKHHCRVCGRIFCFYCSNNHVVIPKPMLNDIPKNLDKDEILSRVCNECSIEIDEFNGFYGLVKERVLDFDMINLKKYIGKTTDLDKKITTIIQTKDPNNSSCIDLNIKPDLNNNKIKAATYCLNKLREIQYKLPTEKLSSLERDLLWTNRKYFAGHSKWDIQLLKLGVIPNILQKRLSCWDTMCTRHCHNSIQLSEMIDILVSNNQLENFETLSNCINDSSRNEIMLFLPVLAVYITPKLCEVLINKYLDDNEFMSEFYWCMHLYRKEDDLNQFDKEIKKLDVSDRIDKMKRLTEILSNTNITTGIFDDIATPINPDEEIVLDKSKITFINSASKPLMVPFNVGSKTKRFLFKREDIRKDKIVSNLISFSCLKLKEAGIQSEAITYKVSPLTKISGLIEVIEKSTTIYNITEKMGFTVQNYINEYNSNSKSNQIIDKFMKSTSIYCIISYLLGFGDRHLDNIMISESGLLFHVDFGYILGKDPKYNNSKHIHLTPEIINVIGGYNSKNYETFKKYCIDVYNELRLHINAFMNMLLVIAEIDPSFTKEYIKNELLSRFEVGETSLEAALHMDVRIIENEGYNIVNRVVDAIHRSKKIISSYY
jgi:hypothetical protein